MALELKDKLYTSTQVADILGVSLRTLYRYMEDVKIKSMRTASGRHRFTKDQILEFLNAGQITPVSVSGDGGAFYSPPKPELEQFVRSEATEYQRRPSDTREIGNTEGIVIPEKRVDIKSDNVSPSTSSRWINENYENDVKKSYQEEPRQEERKLPGEIRTQFTSEEPRMSSAGSLDISENEIKPSETVVQPETSVLTGSGKDLSSENLDLGAGVSVRYYKSEYTDLIELARKIKELAGSRDMEYAFTLYAGLSLHFLIKPFTLLHIYANPEDMQVWKDGLKLSPAMKKEEANIGIIINTDIVFVPTREIGGFKVVDDKVLLRDLSSSNEEELVKKFREHLVNV